MTKRFTILITSAPTASLATQQAINFVTLTAESGHCIDNVFFYLDGVNQANAKAISSTGDFDAYSAWKALSEKYEIPLLVCITAAERRGIIDQSLAHQDELSSNSVRGSFQLVGLSDFFERLHNVDQLVQF